MNKNGVIIRNSVTKYLGAWIALTIFSIVIPLPYTVNYELYFVIPLQLIPLIFVLIACYYDVKINHEETHIADA